VDPSRPSILVVDDERRAVELLARTLRSEGRVETAATGDDAWVRAQEASFDVVISDQRMPGMTGVELFRLVAERDEHVGRILLTGYTDLEASVDAINRGRVHAYLHKPCAPDDVRLTVRAVLDRVRLARENARLVGELSEKNRELERTFTSLHVAQRRVLNSERLAAIGRLIAVIAHDLRTPLSVVRAAGGELLRESAALGHAALGELGREVLAETDAMQRMCSELLEVTRVSEGSLRLVHSELDEVIAAAIAPLAPLAAHHGVVVDIDLASHAAMPLDADRLQRALRNLVQNACEAMPEGGRLYVESRREGDFATIRVIDNGPGIPEEIADRLFEPFATYGKRNGSGLGLAVVRKVLDDHGGTVAATKPEGGGAAFELRLPLTAPER
jgi:signal transduction histidine kinase